jgi:hypothetical protein
MSCTFVVSIINLNGKLWNQLQQASQGIMFHPKLTCAFADVNANHFFTSKDQYFINKPTFEIFDEQRKIPRA